MLVAFIGGCLLIGICIVLTCVVFWFADGWFDVFTCWLKMHVWYLVCVDLLLVLNFGCDTLTLLCARLGFDLWFAILLLCCDLLMMYLFCLKLVLLAVCVFCFEIAVLLLCVCGVIDWWVCFRSIDYCGLFYFCDDTDLMLDDFCWVA